MTPQTTKATTKRTAAAMRAADDIRGEINRGNLVITREEIALIIDREFAEVVEATELTLQEFDAPPCGLTSRSGVIEELRKKLAKLKE